MDGFLNSSYALYMDNYYKSVGLAKNRTSKSTYVCGTLRFDRKGNPENLVKKKLNQGDSEWLRSGSIMVNKWKDKRVVLTIYPTCIKVKWFKCRTKMEKFRLNRIQSEIILWEWQVLIALTNVCHITHSLGKPSVGTRKLHYITWKSSCTMHTYFTTKEIERIKG